MSHYPSTAELAAFRRSLTPYHLAVSGNPFAGPSTGYAAQGAWPEEIAFGIPESHGWDWQRAAAASLDRAGARALRSAAYAAMDPGHYWLPRADGPTAAADEIAHGVPAMFRGCECCGYPAGLCDCYGDSAEACGYSCADHA